MGGFLKSLFTPAPTHEELREEQIRRALAHMRELRAKHPAPIVPPTPKLELTTDDVMRDLTGMIRDLTDIVKQQEARIARLEGLVGAELKEEALEANPEYGTF